MKSVASSFVDNKILPVIPQHISTFLGHPVHILRVHFSFMGHPVYICTIHFVFFGTPSLYLQFQKFGLHGIYLRCHTVLFLEHTVYIYSVKFSQEHPVQILDTLCAF